ncbi:hypothetical protein LL946_18305 [Knoellia locipacati]|uniref:hypothetical protein n=1 Tax=Knoellia locipacati TaxID=882824 RepID=UPI00384B10FA
MSYPPRLYTGESGERSAWVNPLHVPPGGLHGFRNEDGPATMLLHFAPGAPREPYFEGLAQGGGVAAMADDEREEFMAAHDNFWVEE